ncbi:MAG TPA: HAMP domain-containing protein [Chromatiales bacterium]|nr:HAMP domain-containing protein [Thiotrichales bacterium]HIP68410.1 HAMP domain-containing protein [Chromatiales bacterium]
MKMRFSSSIRQLTVLGFLLVVLPLMFALISTVFQVDRLAVKMQKTVRDSAQAVEASRLIIAQALSMERSAEQYGVLRDPILLERYQTQRVQLAEAITRLSALPLEQDLSSQIEKLVQREQALHSQLLQWAEQAGNDAQRLDPELKLAEQIRPIPQAVTQMVTDDSASMTKQIERVQRMLLWQVIALVPLALLLAAVFSVLITRPLRNMGKVIRRLGAGDFTSPVIVSGPQDVRELGEQLDWMRERLAELDQQKLRFLQHMSHELKTPLTAIREGSELLCDEVVGELSDEQKEVTTILRENSLQLQAQVEGLLNFNLALAQDKPAQLKTVDLSVLIPEVITKHQLAMRTRSIQVKTNISPVEIQGEPEQLRTVFDNLLSNAIKYSPDGGVIRVELGAENQQVCLDVIDEGAGINTAERQHIFEPFFQGQQLPKGPVKGSGLGLAIAQRYARLHNGKIMALETQQGAHLRACLPQQQSADGNDKRK